jgi:hypothetical protein
MSSSAWKTSFSLPEIVGRAASASSGGVSWTLAYSAPVVLMSPFERDGCWVRDCAVVVEVLGGGMGRSAKGGLRASV